MSNFTLVAATFNFPINSLNIELINKIQALFSNNATIELNIIDNIQSETDYLLSVSENKKMLTKSIKQLNNNEFVTITLEELTK